MEEVAPTSPDGEDPPTPAGHIPALPAEISAKEQELRRLVDAGAASPEEIRALAAKLEEKRIYEESLWQREVRPALLQSKKRRLSVLDLRRDPEHGSKHGSGSLVMGALLLAGVLLLLLVATQTSFLWLLVAVVGVLVYAWVQGRRHSAEAHQPRAAAPPDAAD